MVVFLSYAYEQRDMAEEIKLALVESGHEVFFDRDSLVAGDGYHARIHKAVNDSDAFLFLISPQSVAQGCYALTELKYAREKWPDPREKVLPVMIERTDYAHIPPYLKAISVLEPEGNAPAEIAAEIQRWNRKGSQNLVKFGGQTVKGITARFIAVLTQPRNFVKSIDHSGEHGLIEASVFAVFVSVANLALMIPTYRLANVKADTLTYLLIDTVITFVFWFLYGSVYHLCAKLFKGRGSYQSSIVAMLYLTAFSIITGILSLPLSLKAVTWGLESSDAASLGDWKILGDQIVQSPSGLICILLILATAFYRWICTIGVFMIIHEVGRVKGILIGLLGSGLSWIVFLVIEKPAVGLFWRAFTS